MKIGVIFKPDVSNIYYRALSPMLTLGELGHDIVLPRHTSDGRLVLGELLCCDVVHVYRGHNEPDLVKGVEELRRRGVAITWDNDDDARLLPPEMPGYKGYKGFNGERMLRRQIAMASKADVVTATTQVLADLFRMHYDGPIEVIENYLASDQYARGQRRPHDGIMIGWVGRIEHYAEVRMLDVASMLRKVMARDDRIRVTTVGVKLDLDPGRYTYIEQVPFKDLSECVSGFDIGIAPLADHPLSYARSNVKVKEYAAARVPWVASARGPYEGLGTKAGGITVSDDRWEQTLLDLASSRLKRMRLRRNAESWSKAQHISRHVERWETTLRMAVEGVARRAA